MADDPLNPNVTPGAPPFKPAGVSPPPPPPAPAPGGNYAAEMAKNQQQTQELLSREQAEYDPLIRQTSALLSRRSPTVPKLEKQPEAPQSNLAEGATQWMQAATVISAIAGAFTRRPATNALTAFAGAINGFKQGKLDVYEQNYKTWEAESKKISENNSIVMQQYQATLADRKMDIDQKMAQINLIALRYHDPLMAQTAEAKNYTAVAQIIERNQAMQQKLDQARDAMTIKHDEAMKKLDLDLAKNGLSRDDEGNIKADTGPDSPTEKLAKAIANYQQAPLSSSGQRSPMNRIIMSRVMQINPEYVAAEYQKRSTAMRMFGTGRQGELVRSLNVSIAHLGTLSDLADALHNKDTVQINRVANTISEQTGNAPPTNFDAAKSIVGKEVVKAIVAGGGGVTERQEAEDMVNRAKSPEQLKGVIATVKQLLAGQLGGLKRQYSWCSFVLAW